MSLGLARDSMLNLSDLAAESKKSGSRVPAQTTEVGESREVAVGLDQGPVVDVTVFNKAKEKAVAQNKFQYSAFTADYSDYDYGQIHYSADPYAPKVFGGSKEGGSLWCCLFPWSRQAKIPREASDEEGDLTVQQQESHETDEISATGSEAYGEKLTDKDRAAVLARLRLVGPDATLNQQQKKGLLKTVGVTDDVDKDEVSNDALAKLPRLRSILKRGSVSASSMSNIKNVGGAKQSKSQTAMRDSSSRRSLFPNYEGKPKKENLYTVQFAPMARVVTVKSRNEMFPEEKSGIWWQKHDYDDFKKAGRLIAKAMLEGGSEVWLATNKSWRANGGANKVNGSRSFHLSDRQAIDNTTGDQVSQEQSDKWWHKFGHSRRGLEHIASVEEGRQRQSNVRTAIRAVVDEQRRQKIYRKEDPDKLRILSLQYTTWARDLALAAGASDAEAVAVDFDPSRKSREFYLLKHARANGGFAKQLPAFMVPAGMPPSMLDAHTSSQIRYRRKVATKAPPLASKAEKLVDISSGLESNKPSIARQAAGYGTGEADMAAVLSGLGADARVKRQPQPQVAH